MPQPYNANLNTTHQDNTGESILAAHMNTADAHINQLETDANSGGPLDLPAHKTSGDHDARYASPTGASLNHPVITDYEDFTDQGADAATPTSGRHRLYAKSGGLYAKDSTGSVVGPFGTSGGGGTATPTGTFMDVFAGALDDAFIHLPTIPTAPAMTSNAVANAYNVPPIISNLSEGPPTTLQAQINAASAGSVLTVTPDYIYREAVTINKALTIKGLNRVSLRGSDDWSTGGAAGNTWSGTGPYTSSLTIPAMSTETNLGTSGYSETTAQQYSQIHCETVFFDGVGLQLVNATPTAGQWQLDGSRHVVLGSNPSGHKIEVGVRQTVITLSTNSAFSMDGIDIRHCSTSGQGQPAVINNTGITTANIRISNCMVGWCHGSGFNFGALSASNLLIEKCILHDIGTTGLTGSTLTNATIRRCVMFNAGLAIYGYDPTFGSGGAKVAGCTGVVFDECIAFANNGCGLWQDVQCTRGVFETCIVWDNYSSNSAQISYEVSSFGVIKNCILFRTPNTPGGLSAVDLGVYISNSRWVDVYNNLIMHIPGMVRIFWGPSRTDDPPSGTQDNTHMGGITVHGNRIIGRYHANTISGQANTSDLAIWYGDDGSGTYTINVTSTTGGVIAGTSVADGNVFGYPALINNGASFLEAQQEPDSRWWYDGNGTGTVTGVTQISTIANWISAFSGRVGQNSRYMLDADRVADLRRFGLVP